MGMHFEDILKSIGLDIQTEYNRLYILFYEKPSVKPRNACITLHKLCETCFPEYKFRGTCISLNDFQHTFENKCGISFNKTFECKTVEQIALFCEYLFILLVPLKNMIDSLTYLGCRKGVNDCLRQIYVVIEKIGYTTYRNNGLVRFVPKDANAVAVAQIISDKTKLSYKAIEYNHLSLKGNLPEKRNIIRLFADLLEPEKDNLLNLNRQLGTRLFNAFNNLNIRHNNCDSNGGRKYKPFVANMSDAEMEACFDDIYQLCLQAFLTLDNKERELRLQKILDLAANDVSKP